MKVKLPVKIKDGSEIAFLVEKGKVYFYLNGTFVSHLFKDEVFEEGVHIFPFIQFDNRD